MERSKKKTGTAGASGATSSTVSSPPSLKSPVTEAQLVDWLRGFQEIQEELNACIGCLDEGVAQIDYMQHGDDQKKNGADTANNGTSLDDDDAKDVLENDNNVRYMSEDQIVEHLDEVFEAVITKEDDIIKSHPEGEQDDQARIHSKRILEQSNRVVKELKQVLVHKAAEHEVREARAIARKNGHMDIDPFGMPPKVKGIKRATVQNSFEDSFTNFAAERKQQQSLEDIDDNNGNAHNTSSSSSTTSSSESQCPTVKSMSPKRETWNNCGIPRSVSGQILESDDEDDVTKDVSSMTESCSRMDQVDSEAADLPYYQDSKNAMSLASSSRYTMSVTSLTDLDQEERKLADQQNSLSDIRSISSPDLKNVLGSCRPYQNFNQPEVAAKPTGSGSESSGSEWGSADELERHVLKSYRRPMRPSARKNPNQDQVKVDQRKEKLRRKRSRNRSTISNNSFTQPPGPGAASSSSYVRKHQSEDNPLTMPRQAFSGFESSVASEVAAKAKNFMGMGRNFLGSHQDEVIIGDSSSDSD